MAISSRPVRIWDNHSRVIFLHEEIPADQIRE